MNDEAAGWSCRAKVKKAGRLDGLREAARRAAGVHYYGDLFEIWVRSPPPLRACAAVLKSRIPSTIRDRGVLFVHVPKNAGTSISRSLYGESVRHRTAQYYRAADPRFFAAAQPFAVLRDPVDRFVSACRFLREGGGEHVGVHTDSRRKFGSLRTAEAFISLLEQSGRESWRLDYVLRPQHLFVCDPEGKPIVKLFRLGADDRALSDHLAALGIAGLSRLNRTIGAEMPLTRSQKARVEAFYDPDLKLIASLDR